MNLNEIEKKCFILALFIRDDAQRFLLGSGAYEFKDSQLHFSANTMKNDVVEVQGNDGYMLAGQVRRPTTQVFDGYIGDASVTKAEIEGYRRDFLAFFSKNHYFTVVYVFADGSAIQRRRGFIVDAPEVRELWQMYPEYHIGMNFEDVNYYRYGENAQGEETYGKSATVGLSTDVVGGLEWEELRNSRQMLKGDGYATDKTDASVWSSTFGVDSITNLGDGWAQYDCTNLSYDCLYAKSAILSEYYEEDEKYTVLIEWKDCPNQYWRLGISSGTQADNPFNESLTLDLTNKPSGSQKSVFTAKSNSDSKLALRLWFQVPDGVGPMSFKFRVMIAKGDFSDDDSFGWEAYGAQIGGVIWDSYGAVWEEGGGGNTTVQVDSIENVYPVWTVTGPANNPILENLTTGTVISYSGNVTASQTLVIDMMNQTVKLNGTSVIANVSGEWLEFVPGNNTVSYTADNNDAPDSTIEWQEVVG